MSAVSPTSPRIDRSPSSIREDAKKLSNDLSPVGAGQKAATLAALRDAGMAICLVTHDAPFATALADRALRLGAAEQVVAG